MATRTNIQIGLKLLVLFLLVLMSRTVCGTRIKDISTIKGMRENQLWGYGIVVGLAGTGDQEGELTKESLNAVLGHLGVNLKKDTLNSRNAAAVIVSAKLPPLSSVGGEVDVSVSSIGSATSLNKGTLLMTPLKGADGNVYAIAQGRINEDKPLLRRDRLRFNRSVTGKVTKGAIVEKTVDVDFGELRELTYVLNQPDFTTAARVSKAVNAELGGKFSRATSASSINVQFPSGYTGSVVDLVARIENLNVESDNSAVVVINQDTGTVVLGSKVRIKPVAVAHNNLKIEIKEELTPTAADQRLLSAEGPADEVRRPRRRGADERDTQSVMLVSGANVSDVVESLNNMGASAPDLIAILKSLEESGALEGRLVVR